MFRIKNVRNATVSKPIPNINPTSNNIQPLNLNEKNTKPTAILK